MQIDFKTSQHTCRLSLSFELFALSSEFFGSGTACWSTLSEFWYVCAGHPAVAFGGERMNFFVAFIGLHFGQADIGSDLLLWPVRFRNWTLDSYHTENILGVSKVEHLIDPGAEKVVSGHLYFPQFLSGFQGNYFNLPGIPGGKILS